MFSDLPLWRLTTARRKFLEAIGCRVYSRPAYAGIEKALRPYLPATGFFVEAGAVDGFFVSNTYHLERFSGWTGILITPVPEMFRRIRVNRKNAIAVHCALVSEKYSENIIEIAPNHAMSRIQDLDSDAPQGMVTVPARTLTSILDEHCPGTVDLLSLDVEGFEAEVFRGLDWERWKPKLILVECLTPESKSVISELLEPFYNLVEEVSHRDLLYRVH